MSRVQLQLTTKATHFLESQEQVSSAGSKYSSPPKPLTIWRAKDRCHKQGPNTAHHQNNSQTGETGTGIMSRIQIQLTTKATHTLDSQVQVL